jgi:hypothetical protein
MPLTSNVDREFARLANEFLALHPEVQHEWREERGWLTRWTSLICGVGQPNEVYASLDRHEQIAVGVTRGHHEDFQNLGGGATDEQVAWEAFDYLVELLRENGQLPPAA